MYKQKLEEQLKKAEELQARCGITDISEFFEIKREILKLATEIDNLNLIAPIDDIVN